MELLDFSEYRMSPFVRLNWANLEAREFWEPRLQSAAEAFNFLEMETVAKGIRSCATTHIFPQDMESRLLELGSRGLMFLPIQKVGQYGGFSHYHPPVIEGRPWSYYGVVSKSPDDARLFVESSDHTSEKGVDHTTIGRLLGFPDCCIEFFNEVWCKGFVDPIWQQAKGVDKKFVSEESEHLIRLNRGVDHNLNDMLRYIGLRIISHLPCSFDCKKSSQIANSWIELGRELEIEGLDDLLDILKWPIEWDCLKGIAIVSTPVFKLTTNSVTCYPRYVVQKEGLIYPEKAARGLKFPFIDAKTRNPI